MLKQLAAVLALGLAATASAASAAAYTFKTVDLRPYLKATSGDNSTPLTPKPGVMYQLNTVPSDDGTGYIAVKCPEPKMTASGKLSSKTFVFWVNIPGDANELDIYIQDMDGEDVNYQGE